jgi:hypothetical protein
VHLSWSIQVVEKSKKLTKSDTLTIRLDPRTRFQLEFLSRLRGQTITTVVERAIAEAANRASIPREHGDDVRWDDIWHVNDGVRLLLMGRHRELFPTADEEALLDFTRTHWPFFYTTERCNVIVTTYVEVLWPKIQSYLDIFERTKHSDYFHAGIEMRKAIEAAGLNPPVWPPKDKDDLPF